jgi:hypothetical protein
LVVCRSPDVAGESVVLKPHAWVVVPIVPGYVGQSAKA